MKEKLSPKDKRLLAFTKEVEKQILHPDYETRVMLATVLDEKQVVKIITGRKCIGQKEKLNKEGVIVENKTFKTTRYFVVFKDNTRLSISSGVFNHLKIDHKIEHEFENYYA